MKCAGLGLKCAGMCRAVMKCKDIQGSVEKQECEGLGRKKVCVCLCLFVWDSGVHSRGV